MNIWIVNHYATHPDSGLVGSPRTFFMAEALTKHGHDVTVVAAGFHHMMSRPPDFTKTTVKHEQGLHFVTLPVRKYLSNGITRLQNMWQFSRAVAQTPRLVDKHAIKRPDQIIYSSPHPFAYGATNRVASKFGSKLVFEIRDIWPESLWELVGMSRLHPFSVAAELSVRHAYRSASAVTSALGQADQCLRTWGHPEKRFEWIPNGIRTHERTYQPPPEGHIEAIAKAKAAGRFVVLYAGAHGPPNALDTIVDLHHVECQSRPYHFFLVGDGVCKQSLRDRVQNERINFVSFLDPVEMDCVQSLLQYADAGYVGHEDRKIYEYGVSPNKVFEYFLAKKPVIWAGNYTQNPVRSAGAGVDIPDPSPNALHGALTRLSQRPRGEVSQLGERGHQYLMKNHSWDVLAEKYVHLLESIGG